MFFLMIRIDVLNLEWASTPSRDRVMATLVCNYLRIHGVRVEERSVFDGYHALNELKPRLLFLTNTVGAPQNLNLMRYAKSRACMGLSLISEGNFQGDSKFQQEMIWGWNKQKTLVEDIHLQWSDRTRTITLQQHPELAGRVRVAGGVGFDNYVISQRRPDRRKFFSDYGKNNYEKIVGVGCWDFGCLYPEDPRYVTFGPLYSDSQIKRFHKDGNDFDKILTEVALAHPNILFLVKHHPGLLLGHKGAGTMGLPDLPNVVILKNEIPVFDCIALSDFWLVYESTTAMEAWLLGKQTCLLNPSGRDFPRDIINEGSPVYINAEQVTSAIHYFYECGELPQFGERECDRRRVIQQTIQWDDGLNHVRAGNEILNLLEAAGSTSMQREVIKQRLKRWKQHVKWALSPYIYKIKNCNNEWANRKNFVNTDMQKFASERLQEQLDFYQLKGLNFEQLRQIRGI